MNKTGLAPKDTTMIPFWRAKQFDTQTNWTKESFQIANKVVMAFRGTSCCSCSCKDIILVSFLGTYNKLFQKIKGKKWQKEFAMQTNCNNSQIICKFSYLGSISPRTWDPLTCTLCVKKTMTNDQNNELWSQMKIGTWKKKPQNQF